MAMGVVFLFLPAAVLLVVAIALLVWAGRSLAVAVRTGAPRTAAVFRLVAGLGALGGAVLCALSPFVEIPYAIVALPFLTVIVAGIWLAAWLIAAAIVESRRRA